MSSPCRFWQTFCKDFFHLLLPQLQQHPHPLPCRLTSLNTGRNVGLMQKPMCRIVRLIFATISNRCAKALRHFFFFISAKCAPWRDFTVSDIAKEFLVGKLLAKRLHGKVGMMQVTCSLGRALGLCRCCAVVLTCGLLPSFNMEVWCTTNTRARLQQNVGQSACAHSRYPTEGRSDTCTTETGVGGSVGDNGRR